MEGTKRPLFDYKGYHVLVTDLNITNSEDGCFTTQPPSNITNSGIMFYLWARFYHPKPRDHLVAEVSIHLGKL